MLQIHYHLSWKKGFPFSDKIYSTKDVGPFAVVYRFVFNSRSPIINPGKPIRYRNGTEKLVGRTPIFCGTSHGDSFFIMKSSWYHTIPITIKLESTVVHHLKYSYSITGMLMFMGCIQIAKHFTTIIKNRMEDFVRGNLWIYCFVVLLSLSSSIKFRFMDLL